MIDLSDRFRDTIRRTIVNSIHSRLPVHEGTPEEMVGVVQAKDLLDAFSRRPARPNARPSVPKSGPRRPFLTLPMRLTGRRHQSVTGSHGAGSR